MKACEKNPVRSQKRGTLSPKKRMASFASVETGLSKEEAVEEARRCLGLRTCESCETCALLCPDLCITRNEEAGEVEIDLEYCKGCGICAAVCPREAIQMVWEEKT